MKSIEKPGYIIAGNPARVVCTVDEYLEKNKDSIVNLDGMGLEDIRDFADKHPDRLLKKNRFKI